MRGERLSGVSSCICILCSRIACFGIEADEELMSKSNSNDHFWFSGCHQPTMEVGKAGIIAPGYVGDEEEYGAYPAASAADRAFAVLLATVVGQRSKADELGNGLVVVGSDLRQFRHDASPGPIGNAFHSAEGLVEDGPQRIIVDQRSDLTFQTPRLALDEGDDVIEGGSDLFILDLVTALLVDDEIVGQLPEPDDQTLETALDFAGGRRRLEPLAMSEAGDDEGVDPVGLLEEAHRLGVLAHTSGIGDGTGRARLPQQCEGQAFVAAGGLHHHQLHLVLATEGGKLGNACGIVGEAGNGLTRHNAGIEVLLRNIYSTDSLGHGNLPCSCVCEPATFRSCVRTAKIPSSPTVVAGGWTGDIAERGAWRPPGPLATSILEQDSTTVSRYKGRGPTRSGGKGEGQWALQIRFSYLLLFHLNREIARTPQAPHPPIAAQWG